MANELGKDKIERVIPAEESAETLPFEENSEMKWDKYRSEKPDLIDQALPLEEEEAPVVPFNQDNEVALSAQDDAQEFIERGDAAAEDYYQNTPEGQAIVQKRKDNQKKMSGLNYYDQSKKIAKYLTGTDNIPLALLTLKSGQPLNYWLGKVAFTSAHDTVRNVLQAGADITNGAFSVMEGMWDWIGEQEKKFDEKVYGIKTEPKKAELARVPVPEFDFVPEEMRTPSVELASNLIEIIGPMVGASAALGGFRAVQGSTKAKKALDLLKQTGKEAGLAGGVAFVVLDPDEKNIADFFNKYPFLKNPITEALASDEDDSRLEGRFKHALLEAGIDIPFGLGVRGIMTLYKAIKHKSELGTQLLKDQLDQKGLSNSDDVLDNVDFATVEKATESLEEVTEAIPAQTAQTAKKPTAKAPVEDEGLKRMVQGVANGGVMERTLMRPEVFDDAFKRLGASPEQGKKMLELGSWKHHYLMKRNELLRNVDLEIEKLRVASVEERIKPLPEQDVDYLDNLSQRTQGLLNYGMEQYHRLKGFDVEHMEVIDDFFKNLEKNLILDPNHKAMQLEPPSIVGSFAMNLMKNERGAITLGGRSIFEIRDDLVKLEAKIAREAPDEISKYGPYEGTVMASPETVAQTQDKIKLKKLIKDYEALRETYYDALIGSRQAGFINFGILKALRKMFEEQRFLTFKENEIYRNIKKTLQNPKVEPFAEEPLLRPSQNMTDYAMNEMPSSGFQKRGQGPGPVIVGSKEERMNWAKKLIRKLRRQPSEYHQREILPLEEFNLQVEGLRNSVTDYIEKSSLNIPKAKVVGIFNKIAGRYHKFGWRLPEDRLPTLSADQFINNMDTWLDQAPKGAEQAKEIEGAIEKAFNLQMPTQALDETTLKIKDLAKRVAATQQPHRPIRLEQRSAHPLQSQKRSQLDALMMEVEMSLMADQRKNPTLSFQFKNDARKRVEAYLHGLQAEEPLLDTAGRILKSKDLALTVSPTELLPGQRKTVRDYRYLNKILGESQGVDELLEAVFDAKRTGKDMMNVINRAGVISYEKPLTFAGKLNDWGRTIQTLIGLRLLSAMSTKYVVGAGLGQINFLKGVSSGLEDIAFDPMVRGLRTASGIPQLSGSRLLQRLFMWKEEMGQASRNAWDYLSFQKNSIELDFSPKTGTPEDLRYEMTKGESPLQHFREWGLNVLSPQQTNRTMKGLRFLFNRAMQAYQLIGGIRIIKGMDIFNRNLNLAPALHNVLRDKWNRVNVIRQKQNLRPYSRNELQDKFNKDFSFLYEKAFKGEGGKLKEIQQIYDETNRMSFMSRDVKIAGTDKFNVGDMTRGITNWIDRIPIGGKFISLFRHVMLNVGDFVTRGSPLAFINPDVRKAWGKGRQAQVLGEAVAGSLIGIGNIALFMKAKEKFMPKNKNERQALRQITGRYAYGPLIRDPEGGKQYILDTGSPVGALTSYYMELYDYLDDLQDTKEFGQFFGDFIKHHLNYLTPYQFIEKYDILASLGDWVKSGKDSGYRASKLIKNGLYAGIIKEVEKWQTGFQPQEDVAQMEGELDESFKRHESDFPVRWNRLLRKAVPMWGGERDIGFPQSDFLGNDMTINHSIARQAFSVVSLKDYYDLNRERSPVQKATDYAGIIRKRLPVKNEPLIMALWKLQDTPRQGEYWDQNPLQLYADYNFTLKEVLKQDAFNEIIRDKKIKKYFDSVNVSQQQLWDRLYQKRFIINDEGVWNINRLAGGTRKVDVGGRSTTGEAEINKFMSTFRSDLKAQDDLLSAFNSPEMQEKRGKMLNWAMAFDKYGNNMGDALKRLVFNPQIERIQAEFESLVKTKPMTLLEKKQELAALMRKRFKPYGYSSRGLGKALAVKVDERDGKFVYNSIIHEHLDNNGKEQNLAFQRTIVNELAREYTSFAKWTYLQEFLFGNKDFNDNLLKEAIQDFEDNTEAFTRTPENDPVLIQGVGF